MTNSTPTLEKSLTRFDATMIVMGTIIGVGIFFQPQKSVAATGSAAWSLTFWVLGSVLAMTGAFTYAALGRLVPKTGGPYAYLREAFGPLPAFLYGWMVLVAIGSGATAVVGLVYTDNLCRALSLEVGGFTRSSIAAGTLILLAAINIAGVKWGSRLLNLFTVIKILALAGLIVAGLVRGDQPISFDVTPGFEPTTSFHGIFPVMAAVLFAIGGWQNLSNVAGEMKSPERDLVPAIIRGVLLVAVIYVLANLGFMRLLSVPELVGTTTPAADALERALGSRAGDAASILIMLSAFGILNGLMLSLPRIYFAMADDRLAPAAFGRVSERFKTPVTAITVQAAIAVAFCYAKSVGALTEYVTFADALFFSLNAFALFAIVKKYRRSDVGLGYPWVPAIFGLLMTALTIGMLIDNWENARFGVLLLAAGVAIYFAVLRPRAQNSAS